MNSNQRRAAELARSIVAGRLPAADVVDADWALLLLAAEVRGAVESPVSVASRVLDRVAEGRGYFSAPVKRGARRTMSSAG